MSNTHTVINRAIGAGLFAAGVGLCVVLSQAPAQPSLAVEACANNLCPSTIGSASTVVRGEGGTVAIGDSSDGVAAPVGRAGLDAGITDPTEGISEPTGGAGLDDVGIADSSDGVAAPVGRAGLDAGITDPTDGVAAPVGRAGLDDAGIGDPSDGVSAPHNQTPSDG